MEMLGATTCKSVFTFRYWQYLEVGLALVDLAIESGLLSDLLLVKKE